MNPQSGDCFKIIERMDGILLYAAMQRKLLHIDVKHLHILPEV